MVMGSPFAVKTLFTIGPVPITRPVATTWAIMALMVLASLMLRRRLGASPGRLQTIVELVQHALDQQIGDVLQRDPAPYRALIGTIFLFILIANWTSLVPGAEPPTATLETDAAAALLVLGGSAWFGVKAQGAWGYLRTFARPSWMMIPLNVVEQFTRSFSLVVRLFGNVMSGVFIIGILLSLAGVFVPIPLMALDLLTGAIQAYIFAILACVFIAAGVSGESGMAQQTGKKGQSA